MVMDLNLFIICLIMGVFGVSAFILAHATKKERRKENEVYKHEEENAEIIAEANKTKADARTGNHERDFNYMASKLHQHAKK